MKLCGLALLVLLGGFGCRDSLVDPDEDTFDPDLLPPLAGRWEGSYEGVLGLPGDPEPPQLDTFHVQFDVWRVGAEFPFEGVVGRGATTPQQLYDCLLRLLVVNREDVQFDCFQGTQFGSTLVLRVEARLDSSAQVLRGQVQDGLGFGGAEYPIELRWVER